MGREKRKGKGIVVEKPVHKRTRAEREAERAEMVAKAAEEQAPGHARSFRIREQPSRGRGRVGSTSRAKAQQTERDSSEGELSAESEGQSSPTPRRSGCSRLSSKGGSPPAIERRTRPRTRGGH